MSEVRIIKKYPNRRLYDTAISSYITLEDVRCLITESIPVKVIDARTDEEITHNTLLQIAIEREDKGPHLFSVETLQCLIRLYGSQLQPLASAGMAESMAFFAKTLAQIQSGSGSDLQHTRQALERFSSSWNAKQQEWLESLVKEVNVLQNAAVEPGAINLESTLEST